MSSGALIGIKAFIPFTGFTLISLVTIDEQVNLIDEANYKFSLYGKLPG